MFTACALPHCVSGKEKLVVTRSVRLLNGTNSAFILRYGYFLGSRVQFSVLEK